MLSCLKLTHVLSFRFPVHICHMYLPSLIATKELDYIFAFVATLKYPSIFNLFHYNCGVTGLTWGRHKRVDPNGGNSVN